MALYESPCQADENNPDDWFIGRDGKQYADEDFLSAAEMKAVGMTVAPLEGETADQHRDRIDKAVTAAESDRRRRALARRRHARDACRTDCLLREACLAKALEDDTPANHGTWGGYYEEELRQLRLGISRRNKRRARRA